MLLDSKYENFINKKRKNTEIIEINSFWEIIKIKNELKDLLEFYSEAEIHFFNKVINWIYLKNDKIYLFKDKNTWKEIWFIFLKDTDKKKKIRTIYIKKDFRNKWYLLLFMKIAIEKLWTNYPNYTVPEELFWIYKKIINIFWHKVVDIIEWLYRKWKKEYIINWKMIEKENF